MQTKTFQICIIVFLILILTINISSIFFKENLQTDNFERTLLIQTNKKLDSLYIVQEYRLKLNKASIDSLTTIYVVDRKKLQHTKRKRNEDIIIIRTMGYDSLYNFFAKR